MPSLSALKEFTSSFYDIAKERKDAELKEQPFEEMPLPETEPAPLNLSGGQSSPQSSSAAPSEPDPDDGFDFSAFLNDLPADVSPPHDDIPDLPSAAAAVDDTVSASPSDDTAHSDLGSSAANISLSDDDLPGDAADNTVSDSLSDAEQSDSSSGDDFLDDLLGDSNSNIASGSSSSDDFLDDLLGDSNDHAESDSLSDGDLPDDFGSTSPDHENLDDLLGDLEDSPTEDTFLSDFLGEDQNQNKSPPADMADDLLSGDVTPQELDEDTESLLGDFQTGIDLGGEDPDPDADYSGAGGSDEIPADDFDFKDDTNTGSDDSLLDDLSSSIDMGGESLEAVPEEGSGNFGDFSLDDFMADSPSADSETSLPSMDDFTAGSESETDDSASLLGDMDFPAGDSDDTDLSDGSPAMDLPSMDDFGLDTGNSQEPADQGFDLGDDFTSDSIDLGSTAAAPEEAHEDPFTNDEFHIAGLDELFDKSKTAEVKPEPVQKKGFFKRNKQKEELPAAEEDIEEIALSQNDVDRLLKTLSSYPLNLRIACEELIAEQVLLPAQLAKLIRLLVTGSHVKETALHVEQITGKPVVIPKSFEKGTGAAFEEEQSSFAYIFIHNFLPVLRLFTVFALLAASIVYLGYQFIYLPLRAEGLYKRGYERIAAGEYQRANDLFHQAFSIHRNKKWFYAYAEAFRDQRRFMLAEGKYEELLRFYPRDKKGVLDYAHLNTYFIMNFEKASRLLQQNILDYFPNDYDALLASGDNFLAWADSDPSRFYDKYEDARFAFARLLELNGWQVPIVERMLKYFIRTDNLREVLQIRVWFENDPRRRLSTENLAELGGYLLDKQLERPAGVPNPFVESIESVRNMLLQAVREDRNLPEPHYHLARYHKNLGNTHEERLTLENAIRAFDLAKTETVRRRLNRVDAHFRYANLLINNREFFPAETQLVRGIELYEEYLNRNLIRATPQLGQLYAAKGDLEFYVKTGDRQAAENALRDYLVSERFGHSPPDMLFRMGSAFYQLQDWGNALTYLFRASRDMPLNRRLLYALGNVAYQRGDYFAAQGYFDRLLDTLEAQRIRLPTLMPSDNQQFLELGERLMMARNNAGVVYEALAEQTGNREFRSRALALYSESARAWDSITRNPTTMTRMTLSEIPGAPGINLGYLNANSAMRPASDHSPQIFVRIDRDGLEPSRWEELAPFGDLR